MTELEIIDRIRRRLPAAKGAPVVAGIGDDCAILRPKGSAEDLLISTDLLVEGVHFLRATHTAPAVGHKALARGLSDLAAMGGRPRFCLVSLALPAWAGARWIGGFYRGLTRLAQTTGTAVLGGDLSKAENLVCDVVVGGTAPRGKALRRDAARPGDAIFVSGVLGGSALGLETGRGLAWQRHLRPSPRLALGQKLRRTEGVHAAMDLSDGLSIDLHRLAKESGVAASLDSPIPVFPGASFDQACHGGEDFELLFTARPGARVPARYGNLPITRIGAIRAGKPGSIECFGWPLDPLGFDHFRDS